LNLTMHEYDHETYLFIFVYLGQPFVDRKKAAAAKADAPGPFNN
jgi:hypothetical protein